MKKYEVEFYEDKKGRSQIVDWIKELDNNPTKKNKSMLKKVYYMIERLEYDGSFIGEPMVKHIKGKIWELRPLPNRIFFCNTRKQTTNSTPSVQEKNKKDTRKRNRTSRA